MGDPKENDRMRRWRRIFWMVACLLALAAPASAQEGQVPDDVPDALRPWVPWVMRGVGDALCTPEGEGRVCRWIGRLEVEVDASGARFEQRIVLERRASLPLPGGPGAWPSVLRVDGKRRPVTASGKVPVVELPAGDHTITGEIRWSRAPDVLPIPEEAALVALRRDGKLVGFPRREGASLWLGLETSAAATEVEDRTNLEVSRHLEDGTPLKVTTIIVARIAGRPRELTLDGGLLAGSRPVRLSARALPESSSPTAVNRIVGKPVPPTRANLPVRLDKSGQLTVQVRAGTFEIRVDAVMATPPGTVPVPKGQAPWPATEYWAWSPAADQRQAVLTGLAPIDASQTSMPMVWRSKATYAAPGGATLKVATARRGIPQPKPDELKVNRALRLSLDGSEFSVVDDLDGTLRRHFRLDLLAGSLDRVRVADDDRLLTRHDGRTGVELRRQRLGARAEWRLQRTTDLPANGWSLEADTTRVSVHLPPGWELVTALGVDDVDGGIFEPLSLSAILVVLVLAAALGALTTRWLGALLAIALLLGLGQVMLPLGAVFFLALVTAVRRFVPVSPQGALVVRGLWWLGAVAMALSCLHFGVYQVRLALFPSSERAPSNAWGRHGSRYQTKPAGGFMQKKSAPPPQEVVAEDDVSLEGGSGDRQKGKEGRLGDARSRSTNKRYALKRRDDDGLPARGAGDAPPNLPGKKVSNQSKLQKLDPKAIIQTGVGVASWEFKSVRVLIKGPVAPGQRFQLLLLPPWATALLHCLRAALLLLAVGLILQRARAIPSPPWPWGARGVELPDTVREGSQRPGPPDPEGNDDDSGDPLEDLAADFRARSLEWFTRALVVCLVVLGTTTPARAEVPPEGVLKELRERITAPAPCRSTGCVEVAELDVGVRNGTRLRLTAQVHAAARSVIRLPGPTTIWVPTRVEVDGRPTTALRIADDGFLRLRVDAGVHEVVLTGPIAGASLTLEPGSTPRRVTASIDGWALDGVDDSGLVVGALALRRLAAGPDDSRRDDGTPDDVRDEEAPTVNDGAGEATVPPYLIIERHLELGVRWTIRTTVTRLTPKSEPLSVTFPLLPGEEVQSTFVTVKGGQAVLALARGKRSLSMTSRLPPSKGVSLVAGSDQPWTEVWTVRCSDLWRCAFDGIAPVERMRGGVFDPTFRPWPGEKVNVQAARPPPAPGQAITVDAVKVTTKPLGRANETTVAIDVRTSVGGEQSLELPADAKVTAFSIQGEDRPVQMTGRRLAVPLAPGSQRVVVTFREPAGWLPMTTSPRVGFSTAVVDAEIVIQRRSRHFAVATWGPAWGPVPLFWGYLLVLVAAAVVVSRVPGSPFGPVAWVLLALGLGRSAPLVAVLVAAWPFALVALRRRRDEGWTLRGLQAAAVAGTGIWLLLILGVTLHGLFTTPDFAVVGERWVHGGALTWYVDRTDGTVPSALLVELPSDAYQVAVLGWAAIVGYGIYRLVWPLVKSVIWR